jgi:hypothetical protein
MEEKKTLVFTWEIIFYLGLILILFIMGIFRFFKNDYLFIFIPIILSEFSYISYAMSKFTVNILPAPDKRLLIFALLNAILLIYLKDHFLISFVIISILAAASIIIRYFKNFIGELFL